MEDVKCRCTISTVADCMGRHITSISGFDLKVTAALVHCLIGVGQSDSLSANFLYVHIILCVNGVLNTCLLVSMHLKNK